MPEAPHVTDTMLEVLTLGGAEAPIDEMHTEHAVLEVLARPGGTPNDKVYDEEPLRVVKRAALATRSEAERML